MLTPIITAIWITFGSTLYYQEQRPTFQIQNVNSTKHMPTLKGSFGGSAWKQLEERVICAWDVRSIQEHNVISEPSGQVRGNSAIGLQFRRLSNSSRSVCLYASSRKPDCEQQQRRTGVRGQGSDTFWRIRDHATNYTCVVGLIKQ